ncbi:MAG: Asp-tRNA(Asn)/Glu-tRNA(Gln) amidotransferase subunit GatC [Patescibacteria group bacterium]
MFDVERLALLARIKLGAKEKDKFQEEFESILNYVSKLEEIDVEDISKEEASQTVDFRNILRDDENSYPAGEFSEDLMAEAPSLEKRYIKVKHILK